MRAPGRARPSIGARMQPEKQASSKGSTIGLALLFGVVGASLASDVDGFFYGAMFGALLAQVFYLRGRVQSLQEQLQTLRSSFVAGQPTARVAPSHATVQDAAPAAASAAATTSVPPSASEAPAAAAV